MALGRAALGLRTPLRLLPTPPRGGAVAFWFPMVPRPHRTRSFTCYRHNFGLARTAAGPRPQRKRRAKAFRTYKAKFPSDPLRPGTGRNGT